MPSLWRIGLLRRSCKGERLLLMLMLLHPTPLSFGLSMPRGVVETPHGIDFSCFSVSFLHPIQLFVEWQLCWMFKLL